MAPITSSPAPADRAAASVPVEPAAHDVIIVPVDGSELSERAVRRPVARRQARRRGPRRRRDLRGRDRLVEVRHVPVLDENDEMVGMVAIRDVLRPLLVPYLGG